jgi:itaconate CoA-transferase
MIAVKNGPVPPKKKPMVRVPTIAFQSSIKDGKISKIVSRLSGPITTPRTDVHYVVTEHDAANLKGLSSTERAYALIGLADAAFRDKQTADAKAMHII